MATLRHTTSGTVGAGLGAGLNVELENSVGTNEVAASIQGSWKDPTNAAEKGQIEFLTQDAASLAARLTLDDVGATVTGELRVRLCFAASHPASSGIMRRTPPPLALPPPRAPAACAAPRIT